ncbi:MAG: hypothetical protein CMP08_00005 [Xanthomonadales bacterium]|nr:hypothetical protein [Xanthomonadales bacterium]|tara:strand:+ start:220 stop:1707 length:1488 start_codon:yes stop_codon:yes gene_type:complete
MTQRPLKVFGADFADYPIMQEMLMGLSGADTLLVGGRSGAASFDNDATLRAVAYFDWQPYQRAARASPDQRSVDAASEAFYNDARWAFERSLDRVFLTPLTAREIEHYFWNLVARLETDFAPLRDGLIVLFAHTPHFPWHIVFFYVCRRLGVPCYIFKRTQTPDGMFFDTELMARQAPCIKARHPVDPAEVLDATSEISGRLARSREINQAAEITAMQRMGARLSLKILRRLFKRRRAFLEDHYYREPWWRLFLFTLRRDRDRRADIAYLNNHADSQAPTQPYVYFALHYQPERTTVPEAGIYQDQRLAIRALAAALPAGWILAVKEHPRQLGDRRPDLRCLHYARRGLYTDIGALNNVRVVHAFTPSAPLLAGARLVASCNGSSVFEGLQQGIPGLTFVPTWHSACPSGPAIDTLASLGTLVQTLIKKSQADVQADFERFIQTQARNWFIGANDDRAAELSQRTRAELVGAMRAEVAGLIDDLGPGLSDTPTER